MLAASVSFAMKGAGEKLTHRQHDAVSNVAHD